MDTSLKIITKAKLDIGQSSHPNIPREMKHCGAGLTPPCAVLTEAITAIPAEL